MSEPIIIETPAPPTRERLVLVPADAVSRTASEPALNVHTSAGRDATPADLARGGYVVQATMAGHLRVKNELADALARAENAEGLLIQRETELRLAREDGDERARDLRQAYERAVAAAEKAERELATERHEHGSTLTSRDMIHNKLAQAERERDEAKAGHNAVQPRVYALEAELADAKAECRGAMLSAHTQYAETVRERDASREECSAQIARAVKAERERDHGREELARLTAPGEGEPTERCLVAQAVAAGADIHVTEVFGNRWRVVVADRDANRKMDPCLAAADVPATLARLLGEVSRG